MGKKIHSTSESHTPCHLSLLQDPSGSSVRKSDGAGGGRGLRWGVRSCDTMWHPPGTLWISMKVTSTAYTEVKTCQSFSGNISDWGTEQWFCVCLTCSRPVEPQDRSRGARFADAPRQSQCWGGVRSSKSPNYIASSRPAWTTWGRILKYKPTNRQSCDLKFSLCSLHWTTEL